MSDKPVLLRRKADQHSQPFEAGHAKRLLAFSRTEWEEVAEKGPAAAPKAHAAAGTKKPAAAVGSTPTPESN